MQIGGDNIDLSEKIELILHVFDQCKLDFQWYEAKLKDAEKRENNILHELEGVATEDGLPPKYGHRAVLATDLQDALITRRIAKDNIAVNQPIVDFINSDVGKEVINKLRQKLGEVRKVEKGQKDRVYFKRNVNEAPSNPVLTKDLNKLIRDWKKSKKN